VTAALPALAKLRFRKGDIIFGRRRACQRKLVVAEMDGSRIETLPTTFRWFLRRFRLSDLGLWQPIPA
jgi:hypothetical protein